MNRIIIFILLALIFINCSHKLTNNLTNNPTQPILFFKDKEGVYQFDPTTKEEKIIYKATETQVFRAEPCKLANDTLTFALKGNLTFDKNEKYFDDYVTVDLKSGDSWLSRRTIYELVSKDTLKITFGIIDDNNLFTIESEISEKFRCASYTIKGPTYNKPRSYSTFRLGDKTVFSFEGNLYMVDRLDTTVLLNFNGQFNSKFPNGYDQPQINPTGQFVIFTYSPGYKDLNEKQSIQRIDLSTRNVTKIKDGYGVFVNPIFSKDGNFLLFRSNFIKKRKNDAWLSDIYVLDLRTNVEQKIGEATIASWK